MSYPRWYARCKKCGVEFYTNLRGLPVKTIGSRMAITCPKGHVEYYQGGELLSRLEEESSSSG
ncbi:MAG: hypothetical protein HY619_01130 [Thaumarchaeota archaeon]|nr:hypothetical protein [Nitrososphaerota archaeon]